MGMRGDWSRRLLLFVDAGKLLEAQAVEVDEARGVVLVVVLIGVVAFHRGDGVAVERVRTAAASVHDVSFVEFEAYFAVDGFLGLGNQSLDGFALGGEPEAVVDHGGVFGDKGVAYFLGFAVHGDGFDVAVSSQQDGAAGGFVDAAALHADEAVFDDVDTADAVEATEVVEDEHDAQRVKQGVAVFFTGDVLLGSNFGNDVGQTFGLQSDDVSLFKEALEVLGGIGSVFGGIGENVHGTVFFLGGVIPGVFQDAGFVGDVKQVAIHGVGFLHALANRDVVALCVGNELGPAGELVTPLFHAPGGNDFELGCQGVDGELEAYLIVSFACGSVGNGIGSFSECEVHHGFGDAGAGNGGAQQVAAFVKGVGLEHREDVVGGKVGFQVADDALGCARCKGFLDDAVEFLRLANVGAVGDDFSIVLLLEPHHEDGCVKATGVCKNDLHFHSGSVAVYHVHAWKYTLPCCNDKVKSVSVTGILLASAAVSWNDGSVKYQQVIITGASSGFGEAFARELAPECSGLVLVARRSGRLQQLAGELTRAYPGLEVRVCPCDLSREGERAELVCKLQALEPARTLLINNAGLGDYGAFAESEPERNRSMVEVNMASLVELTRAMIPVMREKGGAVMNVASLAADVFIPDFAMYAATKAFVASFSEALHIELAEYGIPVLAVCPGPASTGFGDVARRVGQSSGKPAFYSVFYTPVPTIVRGSLEALQRGATRYYPSLRIALAGLLLRNMPLWLLRLILKLRPRKVNPESEA